MISYLQADGRHFQVLGQSTFLLVGIAWLGWQSEIPFFVTAVSTTLIIQAAARHWGVTADPTLKSGLITGLGLSLLLRANALEVMVLAGCLAMGQKFLFRYRGHHFWNPVNAGIVGVITFTGQGWISPGQWGQASVVVLAIVGMGMMVLSKVKRWDTALFFGITMAVLSWVRVKYYLGWEWEVWLQPFTLGSFWLFTLFMITDPMTTPLHPAARRWWAVCVGVLTFYGQYFLFVPTSAQWVLFFMTPLVPLINRYKSAPVFLWNKPFTSTQPQS